MLSCPRCGEALGERARFCSNCGLRLETSRVPPSEARKTVTVLFCDVVGSTGLAEHAEPESLRRVMARYFDEIRDVVEGHGGLVEKFIGDAVMAVFGMPRVHEDDALRAVRAAIEIRRRMSDLEPGFAQQYGLKLAWRTGINTGEVVAGDPGLGQRFVTGDAVNVAARLEQAAQPGEILIGAETRRLVRGAVAVEPLGSVAARGRAVPVEAYRVLSAGGDVAQPASRPQAAMIGRGRAQRALADAFERVVGENTCRLVTVLGAAGIGKSRLVEEFLEQTGKEALTLRGRCLSFGDGITYWPIAEMVRQAAGLSSTDDDAAFSSKVGGLVRDDSHRELVVRRLGELLGRFDGRGEQEEVFWAVRAFVHALARTGPVILVLEDLHWAEPTLLDLIEYLGDGSREVPLLILCSSRQELLESRPSWGKDKAGWTKLNLTPLTQAQTRQLLRNLLGRDELPVDFVAHISSTGQGNPFFVEELVGLLIDSGQLSRDSADWSGAPNLSDVTVPGSVRAVVAARLDALPAPESALLGRASVEGTLFHRSAVVELMPDELHADVSKHLKSLKQKELVQPARPAFADDEGYGFRHQLIRDAAYGALAKDTRSVLHERYARWLIRVMGQRSAEYAEILGYHFEQALRHRLELRPADDVSHGLAAAGAEHLGIAGRRALDRGDVRAAGSLLARAVDLAPIGSLGRTRLLADLADAKGQAGELQAADALLRQAIEHADATGEVLGRAWSELIRLDVLSALSSVPVNEMARHSQQLLATFRAYSDERGTERAAFVLGQNHFWAGRVSLAAQIFTEEIQRHPPGEAPHMLVAWLIGTLYWGAASVDELTRRIPELVRTSRPSRLVDAWALACKGGAAGMAGDFEQGREMIRRAIELLTDVGQGFRASRVEGLWLGPLEMMADNNEEAEDVLLRSCEALKEMDDLGGFASVAAHLGALYVRMGRIDTADDYARLSRDNTAPDDVMTQAQALGAGARVLAARGELTAAREMARRQIDLVDGTDFLMSRGWAWRDLAEVLVPDADEEASEALRRAAENFAAKGATVEEAKAQGRLRELG